MKNRHECPITWVKKANLAAVLKSALEPALHNHWLLIVLYSLWEQARWVSIFSADPNMYQVTSAACPRGSFNNHLFCCLLTNLQAVTCTKFLITFWQTVPNDQLKLTNWPKWPIEIGKKNCERRSCQVSHSHALIISEFLILLDQLKQKPSKLCLKDVKKSCQKPTKE